MKDLWNNEVAVKALIVLLVAGVFVVIGQMSAEDWTSLAKFVFGFYAAGTVVAKGTTSVSNARIAMVARAVPAPKHGEQA